MTILVLSAYIAVAAYFTAGAYRYGVLERPPVRHFTPLDHAQLGGVAVVAGALWPLFLPVLAAHGLRRALAARDARQRGGWGRAGAGAARLAS